MSISGHPRRGSIVTVDYRSGFMEPEMTKRRLAVVISPNIKNRVKLATVVPLSLTTPDVIMPYHKQIEIPFEMPRQWGAENRWIKGDMVNSVGFHRIDFLMLRKDKSGKRVYQYKSLPDELFMAVKRCALHGMGFSTLTKHL